MAASARATGQGVAPEGVVAEVAVDSGDLVERGELLARLDITDLLAERRQAAASLDKAERDLRRASEMHQRQLIAAELLDNARTARDHGHRPAGGGG